MAKKNAPQRKYRPMVTNIEPADEALLEGYRRHLEEKFGVPVCVADAIRVLIRNGAKDLGLDPIKKAS